MLATLVVLVLARSGVAQNQHSTHAVPSIPRDLLERPVSLHTGIGAAHDPCSTASPQAQRFYDQGLAYLHSFVWIEAARSFNQALRLDPELALAEVGSSYAYVELGAPLAARAAIDRALLLAKNLGGHEKHHVDARVAQMAAEEAPRDAAKLAAYRSVLDEGLARFPSDEELWLQRGVAESPDPADRGQGSTAGSQRFYERALALAPNHFAAQHYLTHALENSGRIDEALQRAATYARMAPAIPHAHHMHGHALRRAGRAGQAVAEFEAADRLHGAYFEAEKIAGEFDWHYHHNLDLLATSYQYLGRMAKAEPLLKAAFTMPSRFVVQEFNKREWPVFLLARGRKDEALAAGTALAAHRSPLIRATGHIEAGHALLALGRFEAAAAEANAALHELETATDGAALVAPSLKALQGEFFLRTGQKDKGRAMLMQVIAQLRAAPGPDAWSQALFTLEAIARAAREVEDWEFAGKVAREMQAHDPSYGGTHYALALVSDRAGDRTTARAEYGLAAKAWSTADADLPELRVIRSGS